MSMMRDENGEHGIHGEPDGTRGFEVSGREGGKEKLQRQWSEFVQMGLPVGEEDDAITVEVEREKDVADLEPYATHESMLKEDDARTKGYMELWGHYECAYNALAHRRMVDETQELIDRLITAILGERISWAGPDDPPFHAVIWRAGQERARLLGAIDYAALLEARLETKIEDYGRSVTELRVLAEWMGVSPIPNDPEEIATAIKAAVVNPKRNGDSP